MPESVRDRLSTTYAELLFLLTRSPRYWFDLDPVRIPLACPEARDGTRVIGGARKGRHGGVDSTARTRGGRGWGAAAGKHTAAHPAAATTATCGACRPACTTGRMSPRSR